jgi:hypothetical protein
VKGIAILFIAIMLGVMAAEKQINNLAEYHDFVQALNIQGNLNYGYSVYFLGYRYPLPYTAGLAAPMGAMKNSVPAKNSELVSKADKWLTAAHEAAVKRAYQCKQLLGKVWRDMLYEIENY